MTQRAAKCLFIKTSLQFLSGFRYESAGKFTLKTVPKSYAESFFCPPFQTLKISTKPCRPSFPSSPPALSTAPCCSWKNSTGCPCVPKKQHPPRPHSQSLQPRRTFLTYSHTGSVFLLRAPGADSRFVAS